MNNKKERKPRNYWTKEKCEEVILLCSTIDELKSNYSTVYNLIRKNNWMELFEPLRQMKPNGYWSKERCHTITKMFNNMIQNFYSNLNSYSIYDIIYICDIIYIISKNSKTHSLEYALLYYHLY
jgi:hypothetical protein